MTGRDLISASLRLIGAIAPGEAPSAAEAVDGLASINRMIDSWSNENLLIYANTREASITLVPSQSTYTLGAGGSITTRPMQIDIAMIQDAANTVEYPVIILSTAEFAEIRLKSLQSVYPKYMYDDGGYPQRTLTLFPIPSTANKLNLYSRRAINTITTLDTVLSLPPGYEQALVFNGAIQLAPEYGRPVTQEVALMAGEAKNSIKRRNFEPTYLKNDLAKMGGKSFNMLTGDTDK